MNMKIQETAKKLANFMVVKADKILYLLLAKNIS